MSAFGRDERSTAVRGRLLDAAGESFATRGVAATHMAHIAELAGCSRATLYRYYPGRDELRAAFVNREAVRVASTVARTVRSVDDRHERLTAAILESVAIVRSTPTLAAWFEPDGLGPATLLAASSDVIASLSIGLAEEHLAARWLVRCVVSLLTMPEVSAEDERALVESYMVPPLVTLTSTHSAT